MSQGLEGGLVSGFAAREGRIGDASMVGEAVVRISRVASYPDLFERLLSTRGVAYRK
jgi:hypothetical protein